MNQHNPRYYIRARAVTAALVVLGTLLRLLFLASDPSSDSWPGYIIDEGRWTKLPRDLILFGTPDMDGLTRLHLLIAPAYEAMTTLSFAMFGVGFGSARLVSALSGVGLLLAAVLFLRKRLSSEGLVVVAVALALQPDLLFLSRVAVPEVAAMLFEFLAFAVLVSDPRSPRRAFAAGLVTIMALTMKATAAPIVPVLAATTLFSRADDEWCGPRQLGAYMAGLASPALIALVVGTFVWGGWRDIDISMVVQTITSLVNFDSFAAAMTTLFRSTYSAEVSAFLIPVWIMGGLLVAGGRLPSHPARMVYLGSTTWILGWLLVAGVLAYFPERYVQHVFVPLAINVGAGLTLLQARGGQEVRTSLITARGVRRVVVATCLALPMAVICSPVALTLARVAGVTPGRLSLQLLSVAVLAVVFTGLQLMGTRRDVVSVGLATIPLIFAPLWYLGSHLGLFPGTFWAYETSVILGEAALLVGATAATAYFYPVLIEGKPLLAGGYAYGFLFAGLWMAQVSPWFLNPTYTMVEASTSLGELVDESTLVWTGSAGSIFLGNRLHFTETLERSPDPEVLVVAIYKGPPSYLPGYRVVNVFDLQFARCPSCGDFDTTLRVYRRP